LQRKFDTLPIMNFREFRQLKAEKSPAYLDFKSYTSSQGRLRQWGLFFLLYISFLWPIKKIPVLSGLTFAVKGLLIGHLVESRVASKSSSNYEISGASPLGTQFISSLIVDEVFDCVIVGSGPGGAIAARKFDSSSRVLVVEQGGYPKTSYSRHHTLEHVKNDFYKSGQEIALSSWLPQFAQASVLGGGSEVNSGLYHDLPEYLNEKFANASGLSVKKFLESQEKVRSLLKVSQMDVNPTHSPIARSAIELGFEFKNIPRWRTYYESSKFVQHGMIDIVWNQLSYNENFQFQLNTRVQKIENQNRNYLKLTCINSTGKSINVLTKNLILAAGAIQTPSLLCRNGLISWGSTNFQWHPMVRSMIKTFPSDLGLQDVDPYQSWTSDRKFKFGSAVSTPGLTALNLGMIPSDDDLPQLRSIYGSFVSSGKGGLLPGTAIPYYLPSADDRENLNSVRSLLEQVVGASGATYANADQRIKKGVSTVHIFGTLPIDSSVFIPGTSRLQIDPRIQISDGSIMPFGPGVNPQGVIMSLCESIVSS
jgi:hypothetical protein